MPVQNVPIMLTFYGVLALVAYVDHAGRKRERLERRVRRAEVRRRADYVRARPRRLG